MPRWTAMAGVGVGEGVVNRDQSIRGLRRSLQKGPRQGVQAANWESPQMKGICLSTELGKHWLSLQCSFHQPAPGLPGF